MLEIAAEVDRRIGNELHDNIQQQLTGLGLLARSLADSLTQYSIPEADLAARLAKGISKSAEEVHWLARGLVPVEVLKSSPYPFAEASNIMGGAYSGYIVAAGAAVAGLGALNGWILISGQIPMAAARDKLFPRIFKAENKREVPSIGIVIGSLLASLVMLMNYSESLVEQFELMILLSTLTALVPYLFTAASYGLVLIETRLGLSGFARNMVLAALGFAYSLWTIYGSGNETVFYGFLLLLAGMPFYVLMKYNQKKDK